MKGFLIRWLEGVIDNPGAPEAVRNVAANVRRSLDDNATKAYLAELKRHTLPTQSALNPADSQDFLGKYPSLVLDEIRAEARAAYYAKKDAGLPATAPDPRGTDKNDFYGKFPTRDDDGAER